MVVQDVLAWVLPVAVAIHRIGYIVNELEEKVGSIVGLKSMTVRPSFFEKHVVGRSISEQELKMLSYPLVVMHLQGDKAMDTAVGIANDVNKSFGRDVMCVQVFDLDSAAKEAIELWFPNEPERPQEECKELLFLSPTGKVVGDPEEILPDFYFRQRGVVTALQCYFTKDVIFLLLRPRAINERKVGTILKEMEKFFLPIHGLKLVKLNDYPSNDAWSCDSSSDEYATACNPLGVAVVLKMEERQKKILLDSTCLADRGLAYISDNWKTAWQLCDMYFPLGFVFRKDQMDGAILEASLIGLI